MWIESGSAFSNIVKLVAVFVPDVEWYAPVTSKDSAQAVLSVYRRHCHHPPRPEIKRARKRTFHRHNVLPVQEKLRADPSQSGWEMKGDPIQMMTIQSSRGIGMVWAGERERYVERDARAPRLR